MYDTVVEGWCFSRNNLPRILNLKAKGFYSGTKKK